MTSMMVAPRPMRNAQPKPRRAPSLTMEMLMGPTGMETRKPLTKPVSAGTVYGDRSAMRLTRAGLLLRLRRRPPLRFHGASGATGGAGWNHKAGRRVVSGGGRA